jgi:hypothetical protein
LFSHVTIMCGHLCVFKTIIMTNIITMARIIMTMEITISMILISLPIPILQEAPVRAARAPLVKKKKVLDFGAFVTRPNPPNTEFRRCVPPLCS